MDTLYGLAFLAKAYNPHGEAGKRIESTNVVTQCNISLRCLQRGRTIAQRESEGELYRINGYSAILRRRAYAV